MRERWSNEKAWDWYKSKKWIRGCNFISSDCANRIDQWQSYGATDRFKTVDEELALAKSVGFNSIRVLVEYDVWDMEHDAFMQNLETYLQICDKHGITCMIVLANDCQTPKENYKKTVLGEQHFDLGYHGGRKVSPHQKGEETYNIFDEPEIATRYIAMVREIITKYKDDKRVILWNILNEPGNRRGDKSLEFMKKMFQTAREIDPIQPLAADIWNGINEDGSARTNIEQAAMDLSDVISFHWYGDFCSMVKFVTALKKTNRPIFCTEWLHRISGNNIFEIFPYFFSEGIASYQWGLVASYKTQYFEPWNMLWEQYDNADKDALHLDFTKWQHDLFRPSHHPYDPNEIKIIKEFSELADRM